MLGRMRTIYAARWIHSAGCELCLRLELADYERHTSCVKFRLPLNKQFGETGAFLAQSETVDGSGVICSKDGPHPKCSHLLLVRLQHTTALLGQFLRSLCSVSKVRLLVRTESAALSWIIGVSTLGQALLC